MHQDIPTRLTELVSTYYPGWIIEECIGQGSYSKVYRICQKDEVGSNYALKWMEYTRDSKGVAEILERGGSENNVIEYLSNTKIQLKQEIELMDRLGGNSYIVDMKGHKIADREDGGFDLLILMEYLDPLPSLTAEMTIQDVRKVGMDICLALIECENEGVTHRDIKPANIFRNRQGRFKLGDFGVARQQDPNAKSAPKGNPQGTPLYMAPEVYYSKPYVGIKADIYSLGLVLYELLNAQHPPFIPLYNSPSTPEQEEESVSQRMSGKDFPRPMQASQELNTIIQRACSYDPEDRYDSIQQMFEDLEALDLQNAGKEKLKTLAELPPIPLSVRDASERDVRQNSKRTEKSSPSDTNLLAGANIGRVDDQSTWKHPVLSSDDEEEESPSDGGKPKEERFTIQSVIDMLRRQAKDIKQKKEKRIRILVMVVVTLLMAVAFIFLMRLMGQVGSLEFSQNGTVATVTWKGGSESCEVSVMRDDKAFMSEKASGHRFVSQLAPGYDYTIRIADRSVDAAMQELPEYMGDAVSVSSVKLKYYLVKAGDAESKKNDTDKIDYTSKIGMEREKGYLLRMRYKISSGEDIQAQCFIIASGFQEMRHITLSTSQDHVDIDLNEVLKTVGDSTDKLIYKVYVDGCLLTEGAYPVAKV